MNDETGAWARFVSSDDERRGGPGEFWSSMDAAEIRRELRGVALTLLSAAGLLAAGLGMAWGLS